MIKLIRKSKLQELESKIEALELDVDNHLAVYDVIEAQLENTKAEIASFQESLLIVEEVVRDSIASIKSRK